MVSELTRRSWIVITAVGITLTTQAQNLDYRVEAQATVANNKSPLWLNANKYGLSSIDKSNGYLRAAAERSLSEDSTRRWGWGAALDMAVAYGFTSTFVLQQGYVEGRWLHGTLTIGSKEYPMELKNNHLSSGSQTLGINARPVPQIRLALPEYTKIWPWLYIKGHVAYGWFTDGNWQEDFTRDRQEHVEGVRYHSKAGYLRFGRPDKPFTVEAGLEMAAQYGGKKYNADGTLKSTRSAGLKEMWDVFWGAGGDPGEGEFANASGNQLGSWVLRINWDKPSYRVSAYADHYFNDHSQMFFLDYDGYGSGDEWNDKKDNRYYRYALKDNLWGLELNLKHFTWVRNVVGEYLYTKYQSGPIYHDHGTLVSYHLGGNDDYMNHNFYGAWQHWGQVMGNPLYTSPIYNSDGKIRVESNRFWAWHFGMDGILSDRMKTVNVITYRMLLTWQKSWGTYKDPYVPTRKNTSMLVELGYAIKGGWSVQAAASFDHGEIYGNNKGVQLTIIKKGRL
ncbi:MAG: capsule assembly Wzi family protein [Prevotella sp.]|jgi:hypothetical protein